MRIGLLFLSLFVATFSLSSHAELVMVSERDGSSFYVDTTRIEISGTRRRAWVLSNYTDENKSNQVLYEFDCQNKRQKMISMTTYLGVMGEGQVKGFYKGNDDWDYMPPNSHADIVAKFVCSYKQPNR